MLKRLRRWLVDQVLGREANAIAKGKRGARAQGIYWAIAGRKRLWGALLGALALLATLIPEPEGEQIAAGLAVVAGPLLAFGFIDKDWRSPPESAPRALAGVAAYSSTVGAALVACSEVLETMGGGVPWASLGVDVLDVVAAVLAYLGIATFARVVRPPK